MIVRDTPEGASCLITQIDHADLAGQLSAHWGNAMFAPPEPYAPMVQAAYGHDNGWVLYDSAPGLNAEGRTPGFARLPVDALQLAAYGQAIATMHDVDPYAGFMVGRHRSGLWRGRYGMLRHPAGPPAGPHAPMIEAFIGREETRQEALRVAHGWDQAALATNYHLLQIWDVLSLYLCMRDPVPETIDAAPTGYAGAAPQKLSLRPIDARTIALDPFPFDQDGLVVSVPARRLAADRFDDLGAFRRAYYQAPADMLRFTLVAG